MDDFIHHCLFPNSRLIVLQGFLASSGVKACDMGDSAHRVLQHMQSPERRRNDLLSTTSLGRLFFSAGGVHAIITVSKRKLLLLVWKHQTTLVAALNLRSPSPYLLPFVAQHAHLLLVARWRVFPLGLILFSTHHTYDAWYIFQLHLSTLTPCRERATSYARARTPPLSLIHI